MSAFDLLILTPMDAADDEDLYLSLFVIACAEGMTGEGDDDSYFYQMDYDEDEDESPPV